MSRFRNLFFSGSKILMLVTVCFLFSCVSSHPHVGRHAKRKLKACDCPKFGMVIDAKKEMAFYNC